jgi:integrase
MIPPMIVVVRAMRTGPPNRSRYARSCAVRSAEADAVGASSTAARSYNGADGLVFGGETAFQPSNLWRRAQRAWKRAGLEPIGLHEARHTFASVLIAAGVNAKAITTYMGHASIQTTYDVYGKLMPGSEAEAAALVDAFLAKTSTSQQPRVTLEHS